MRFLAFLLLLVAAQAQAQFASGRSTLTSGTTATSGCTAGGVLHSASNLVVCNDTDLTFNGTTLTATGLTVTNAPTFSALTQYRIPVAGTAGLLGDFSGLVWGASGTAGRGLDLAAGTATTDVAALSVTRTNNNAAVATGVKFTFTDTTSAAGFLPFQILGGVAGSTNLLSVSKDGTTVAKQYTITSGGGSTATTNIGITSLNSNQLSLALAGSEYFRLFTTGLTIKKSSGFGFSGVDDEPSNGHIAFVRGTAPTIASGGCTSPTVTNNNGTAHFTIDVGTSCSGSQPVVFTLPAATTGWNCYARNITNGATSAPAQTGAVSTTSVTITNFVRTTGVAGAWTDGDDVVVSCLGG